MELKFLCENCDCTELEVITSNVTATTPIKTLSDCGNFDYGNVTLEGDGDEAFVDVRFQCRSCGTVLIEDDDDETEITSNDELVEYLESKQAKPKETWANFSMSLDNLSPHEVSVAVGILETVQKGLQAEFETTGGDLIMVNQGVKGVK